MTDAPVFVGPDDHDASVQTCIFDRDGKVPGNGPCKIGWQAISAAVVGHFAKPQVDVASL